MDGKKGDGTRDSTVDHQGIKKWRSPLWNTAPRAGKFSGLAEAEQNQETIGWERIFYDKLVTGWVETQQGYNKWVRKWRLARRWGTESVINVYGHSVGSVATSEWNPSQ